MRQNDTKCALFAGRRLATLGVNEAAFAVVTYFSRVCIVILKAATSIGALAFCLMAINPAMAQDVTAGTDDAAQEMRPGEEEDAIFAEPGQILVVATRIKGQVDTTLAPIAVLDEEAIASYGAGSIQELLTALSPQTSSAFQAFAKCADCRPKQSGGWKCCPKKWR